MASAFSLDRRLFAALSGTARAGRPRISIPLVSVAAVSIVLGLMATALLALGVTLVVVASWPLKVLGLFLVGCVIELRPRMPRLEISPWTKTRSEEPALFAVIDSIADHIGAPSVKVVVIDEAFDASCARYGLRRRPALVLGLPLWAALGPEARIALLAHQLAHLVNNDPDQKLVTQPALTTFGLLADSFAGRGRALPDVEISGGKGDEVTAGQYAAMIGAVGPSRHSYESMAGGFSALLCLPLRWVCLSIHHRLRALTAESRHRSEYYADALALEVAGSPGLLEYFEALLLRDAVFTVARRWLRVGGDVAMIHMEAAEIIRDHATDLRLHEQRSIRTESSLFSAHPPTGWRLRMLRSWPTTHGRLSPHTLDLGVVDSQLAQEYRRIGRAMTHIA